MWKRGSTYGSRTGISSLLRQQNSSSFVRNSSFTPNKGYRRIFSSSACVIGTSFVVAALGTSHYVFADKSESKHFEVIFKNDIKPSGNVWAWGQGFLLNKIANGSYFTTPQLLKVLSQYGGIKQVAMGERCASFITEKGELYIWTDTTQNPLKTPLKNVVKTACGKEGIIVAITAEGKVMIWDPRSKSEGGLVNLTDAPPKGKTEYNYRTINLADIDPAVQEGSWWWPWGGPNAKFVNVACGSSHVVLLTSQGKVYTLGTNACGQCGLGQPSGSDFHPDPTLLDKLADANIVQIACGDKHTVALADNGSVLYFGSDAYSTTTGASPIAYTPQEIFHFTETKFWKKYGKVKLITCGADHTLVLTEGGALFGWGNSKSGQIPSGRVQHATEITRVKKRPFLIPADAEFTKRINVTQIECGREHCAALTSDGDIYTFGNNYLGQCGLEHDAPPSRANVTKPRLLKDIQTRKDKVKAVACAENVTVVMEK